MSIAGRDIEGEALFPCSKSTHYGEIDMTLHDRDRIRDRKHGPTTKDELEATLDALVRAAHANGVRVSGGYNLRHPAPDSPDWGVEIVPVRKRRSNEAF